MTWHSLPLFVRLAGRPVILLGDGEAAAAKRRLLERAGAEVVADHPDARLAIVAVEDEDEAIAAVSGLKKRGVLVNAVDRPALCDFTLPAIVDRDPVLVAIGTGGVSAGLAAALRQRLEGLLPAGLGDLARRLYAARDELRRVYPEAGARRRAIGAMLGAGGALDVLREHPETALSVTGSEAMEAETRRIWLRSRDPDDLTLREARWLADADRVVAADNVPRAVLDRARADAARLTAMPADAPGLTVIVEMP